MNYTNLCINCMREKPENSPVCPYCGYDERTYAYPPYILPPFTPLNGKYIIGRMLGAGGFGITYIAIDTALDRVVAIKEFFVQGNMYRYATMASEVSISASSAEDRDICEINRNKFEQEAKTLARLTNMPGIVRVYDFFRENNTSYMTLEYLPGQTLEGYVKKNGGRLTYQEVVTKLTPVMVSLDLLHKTTLEPNTGRVTSKTAQNTGIIHRDISPDNIMVSPDNVLTLFDFGGAKIQHSRNSSMVLAKKGYTPYEQIYSAGQVGPWSDVYAMAATIYYCLCGHPPVESAARGAGAKDPLVKPSAEGAAITASQEKVLLKGLAMRPEDRYQSMLDFRNALEAALGSGGNGHSDSRPKSQKPLKIVVPAALALVAVIGGLFVWNTQKESGGGEDDVPVIATAKKDQPEEPVRLSEDSDIIIETDDGSEGEPDDGSAGEPETSLAALLEEETGAGDEAGTEKRAKAETNPESVSGRDRIAADKSKTDVRTDGRIEKETVRQIAEGSESRTEIGTGKQTEKQAGMPAGTGSLAQAEKMTVEQTVKETEKQEEKAEGQEEIETEKGTEKQTEQPTERQTEQSTEKQTERQTEKMTEKQTEQPTEKQTEETVQNAPLEEAPETQNLEAASAQILEDYNLGKLSYGEASAQLKEIGNSEGGLERLDILKASKDAYQEGITASRNENTAEALASYEQVVEEDVNYVDAQDQIEKLRGNEVTKCEADVNDLLAQDRYQDAIARVRAAEEIIPDSMELAQLLQQCMDRYSEYALDSASQKEAEQDYNGAKEILSEVYEVTGDNRLQERLDHYASLRTLTVNNGAGSGSYLPGETVNLEAAYPQEGKVFAGWEVDGQGAQIQAADRSSTSMTMPESDVTVTAVYQDGPTPDGNGIQGLSGEYTAGDTVSFTAVGNGMENTAPNPGDYRYRPDSYLIEDVSSGTWDGEPYTASATAGTEGEYYLEVYYNKEIFDGQSWVWDGDTDWKTAEFSVARGSEEGIHTYDLYYTDSDWTGALASCQQMGGYLVHINSEEEYNYIVAGLEQMNLRKTRFYVGARRDSDSSTYYWADETNTLYGDSINTYPWWLKGEPSLKDLDDTEENVVELYYNTTEEKWVMNDVASNLPDVLKGLSQYSDTSMGFICEYDDSSAANSFPAASIMANDKRL